MDRTWPRGAWVEWRRRQLERVLLLSRVNRWLKDRGAAKPTGKEMQRAKGCRAQSIQQRRFEVLPRGEVNIP